MTVPGIYVTEPTTADVGAQRVARIYAEALLAAAEKRGAVDEIQEELNELASGVLGKDADIAEFFGSHAIGREDRAAVVRKVLSGRCSDLLLDFLLVTNEHDRLELLRPIRMAYTALRDQQERRVRVDVTTVVPLSDAQTDQLARQIRQALELEPRIVAHTDPELLGGMVLRVGDWLYDASVRTQISTLREQILSRSSHEIQSGRDRFSTSDGN